jgi:hypothetical protein
MAGNDKRFLPSTARSVFERLEPAATEPGGHLIFHFIARI